MLTAAQQTLCRFRLPLRIRKLIAAPVTVVNHRKTSIDFAQSTGSRHDYVTVLAPLKEHAFRRVASGRLRPNDQVHVTVEHLQQREQLIHRLAVVRLIEQTIQLRGRRPQPAHDLPL